VFDTEGYRSRARRVATSIAAWLTSNAGDGRAAIVWGRRGGRSDEDAGLLDG
jgi:hypothetical protein